MPPRRIEPTSLRRERLALNKHERVNVHFGEIVNKTIALRISLRVVSTYALSNEMYAV